jgi:hypothetical protein
MQSQNRFISPFRALQKRFYETKPESIHTKHDFVLWKWTRSPSARAVRFFISELQPASRPPFLPSTTFILPKPLPDD